MGSEEKIYELCQQILGSDKDLSHIKSVFEVKSKVSKGGDFRKFLA